MGAVKIYIVILSTKILKEIFKNLLTNTTECGII